MRNSTTASNVTAQDTKVTVDGFVPGADRVGVLLSEVVGHAEPTVGPLRNTAMLRAPGLSSSSPASNARRNSSSDMPKLGASAPLEDRGELVMCQVVVGVDVVVRKRGHGEPLPWRRSCMLPKTRRPTRRRECSVDESRTCVLSSVESSSPRGSQKRRLSQRENPSTFHSISLVVGAQPLDVLALLGQPVDPPLRISAEVGANSAAEVRPPHVGFAVRLTNGRGQGR